jgi:hypothetical protein
MLMGNVSTGGDSRVFLGNSPIAESGLEIKQAKGWIPITVLP